MKWSQMFIHRNVYEFSSNNKYGRRYKQTGTKAIPTVRMNADPDSADELKTLILLGHHLDVPVHYDFGNPQTAFITVASVEKI